MIEDNPLIFFGALAALIFLGFLGNLVFSRLRFNDTILLIGLGVLLGPVFHVIDPANLVAASAIIGPLALILILFDGGLALKFRDILHGVGSAASLGVLGFAFTMSGVGLLLHWALGTDLVTGMILGAIVGGTSALVVMPSLQHMKTSRKTATVLGLESAVTDILVVVVAFTLVSIVALGGGLDPQTVASSIIILFSMSIFIGAAAGFLWLWLSPSVRDKPYGYMMTLGVMFALYVVVEWILEAATSSGGGPLAVLAFGVVLANSESMGEKIKRRVGDAFAPGIKRFQGEIAFIVRTFFFIYLGILVEIELLRDAYVWALGAALMFVIIAARYVAVAITTRSIRLRGEAAVMLVMLPRGLAAAVMAAVPASFGIPGTEMFVALAFLVLILSNMFTTVGSIVLERVPRDEDSIAARKQQREEHKAAREAKRAGRDKGGKRGKGSGGAGGRPARRSGRDDDEEVRFREVGDDKRR